MKPKLIVTTFPDNSQKVEVKDPFTKFKDCRKFLEKQNFKYNMHLGNVWRFVGELGMAYINQAEQTHPYSHPERGIYRITFYPIK